MSKKVKKNGKFDEVMQACRDFRCSLEQLFLKAAEHVNKVYGRRIKRCHVMEAIGKYKNRRFKPDWLLSYLRQAYEALSGADKRRSPLRA